MVQQNHLFAEKIPQKALQQANFQSVTVAARNFQPYMQVGKQRQTVIIF